ncbi:MAG: hypothetical protein QXN87_01590 [Candidatus Bathyarchaeia archaeon]
MLVVVCIDVSGTIAVEAHNSCMTHESSSGSRNYGNKTTTITIRIPVWLYERLKKKGILNISNFVRKLLVMEIEGEQSREEELESQLENLKIEMEKLQNYHSTLLKHGSYAKEYLEKLKDGTMITHKPFSYSKPGQLALSKEEQELVDETVKIREELAKQYGKKLKELLTLKRSRLENDLPKRNQSK